jgi:acetoin utilization protein AcuB
VLEGGEIVGIVSDRDLRSATPALGDPDRAAALERLRVVDYMSREVTTVEPEDPIEQAAKLMREERVGCLPVVEAGELAGILTSSDVMGALVGLVGAYEPGSRIEVALSEHPDALSEVVEVFRKEAVKVVSVLAGPEHDGGRVAVFRADTINPLGLVERLEAAGYPVLWPPLPPGGGDRS